MKIGIRITAMLCTAVLMLGLAGCGSKTDEDDGIPESTGGQDVVRAAEADTVFSLNCNMQRSLNPLIATNHSNQLVCSFVYENMVDLDDNFEVIPNLITSWECNSDATYWTFTIDTTHTFHDGTPVTGKDLRYSLERAINADRYSGRFASFQGVSYSDDSMSVTLGIGDSDFIKLLNIPVIEAGSYTDDYPMGSGPYMYNEDHTQLDAYTPYFERLTEASKAEAEENGTEAVTYKAPVDTIYLKEYDTAEEIISAFEDGYIDLVLNDPSSYTNLGYASSNEIHSFATTNMHYVMCNTTTGICQDSNFRYALNYAFDRSYLVTMLNGNAVASSVPMYPTCSYYPTTLANSLSYNLDKVRIVFENCGITDNDGDGKLESGASAENLSLTFAVCSDSSAKVGVVQRFADDMEEMGLTIDVEELTWDEYKTALLEGTFDLYYGEMKLRNNFDITPLLEARDDDYDEDRYIKGVNGAEDTINVTNLEYGDNLNFSGIKDDNCISYIRAYLAAGSLEKASAYQDLCEYITNNGYLITIGFEKQQIINHRGELRGLNANLGNPAFDIQNWTISLK